MRWLLVLVLPLLFVFVFFVYPICRMLMMSVFDPEFTLEHYVHFFKVPAYLQVLIATFKMGVGVTIVVLLLGYPVAYLISNVTPKVRNLLLIMVILPFMTAILVRTYAWMVILGRSGILNGALIHLGLIDSPLKLMYNIFGVYVGMVQILLPFMILPIYSVMTGIDRRLLKAAESLGAKRFQVFLHIFLPLSLPGVGGGCLLVLIIALGFFVTPALLGGPSEVMVSMFIQTQVENLLNWGFGAAIAVVLLGMTLVIFYMNSRFFGIETVTGH